MTVVGLVGLVRLGNLIWLAWLLLLIGIEAWRYLVVWFVDSWIVRDDQARFEADDAFETVFTESDGGSESFRRVTIYGNDLIRGGCAGLDDDFWCILIFLVGDDDTISAFDGSDAEEV